MNGSTRTAVLAALLLMTRAGDAADKGPQRSPDCASPQATKTFLHLSLPEAREILNRQFSQENSQRAPLAYDGLDYACITSYQSEELREVAIFGRSGVGDLRLFVTGEGEATRLQDAINRLIHEARREQAKKKKTAPPPRPRP